MSSCSTRPSASSSVPHYELDHSPATETDYDVVAAPVTSDLAVAPCRTEFDPTAVDGSVDTLRLVLDAVVVAQGNDERCGFPPAADANCRAVWLLEVLDPVTVALEFSGSKAERVESLAALRWAIESARDLGGSADPDLSATLGRLLGLSESLTMELSGVTPESVLSPAHEERIAAVILDRALPSVVEPLARAQRHCLAIS